MPDYPEAFIIVKNNGFLGKVNLHKYANGYPAHCVASLNQDVAAPSWVSFFAECSYFFGKVVMTVTYVFILAGTGLVGLCCGIFASWLLMRSRLTGQRALADERVHLREAQLVDVERRLAAGDEERVGLRRENAMLQARGAELAVRLEAEQRQLQEKQELLQEARQELANAFKAISADIFQSNSQRFLDRKSVV